MPSMARASHDHPIFTQVFRAVAAAGERTGLGDMRTRVLMGAEGRLLIVGLGPGHDLAHLPDTVTSVVAVEPSASMREAAEERVSAARRAGMDIYVYDAVGEDLPLEEDSVDAVLLAHVLCSVDSIERTLSEVARVLKPLGTIHVMEHVAAEPGTWTDRMQRAVSTGGMWGRFAGGCNCRVDARSALSDAGFDVSKLKTINLPNVPVVSPTLVGIGRPIG